MRHENFCSSKSGYVTYFEQKQVKSSVLSLSIILLMSLSFLLSYVFRYIVNYILQVKLIRILLIELKNGKFLFFGTKGSNKNKSLEENRSATNKSRKQCATLSVRQ